jgi:hypothetical protein
MIAIEHVRSIANFANSTSSPVGACVLCRAADLCDYKQRKSIYMLFGVDVDAATQLVKTLSDVQLVIADLQLKASRKQRCSCSADTARTASGGPPSLLYSAIQRRSGFGAGN